MIQQSIWKFVRAGMKMNDFQSILNILDRNDSVSLGMARAFQGMKIEDLDPGKKAEFVKFIAELSGLAQELSLPVSQTLLIAARDDPPRTGREFALLLLSVRREMHEKLFIYIPAERAAFWEWDDVMSEDAKSVFADAYVELREAANCYAAERYTATVFHSMRAAEIGLRDLGRDLGVQFPDKPIELAEWQNIIEQIEAKIKNKVNSSAIDAKQAQIRDADRKFYSEVAAQFRYFKDGWRIRVAHSRETYTGSQALTVLSHAREFFEDLAKHQATRS